jgi:hypothetical protein
MRLFVAILAACAFMAAPQAIWAQPASFPYKGYVNAEDVYVRSGPGQSYYPTDKLKVGQEVEVYRHDPGGWCAIRPVEGSFTWVSSRYLKPTEKNLAVVTGENVEARIGSRFSNTRDVIMVRLHKGEVVEVVDPPSHGADENEAAWVKIAPPSGEFRWIAAKYVDLDPPNDGVRKPHGDGRTEPSSLPVAAGGSPSPGSPPAAEAFQAELDRLDLELSAMAIEDPAAWSFDALRDRANRLLDQAQTAVERGRARLLVNKIARFDDIKQRYDAVQAMHDSTDRSTRLLASLKNDAGKRVHSFDIDDRFDGVGQLTQIASPKQGAPRYALIDESGSVRCYVTPAPGVNLQNYIGKQVGITGSRGFMPEQHTSHIMARHVTLLNGQVARSAPPTRPRSVVR